MSKSSRTLLPAKKSKAPWILFLVLLLSIYAFWILPKQLGPRRVKAEFEPTSTR